MPWQPHPTCSALHQHRQRHAPSYEKSLYSKLELSPDASLDEVKRAYLRLAKEHHPDRNQGSEESAKKFRSVKDAYERLRTPPAPKLGPQSTTRTAHGAAADANARGHTRFYKQYSTHYNNASHVDPQTAMQEFSTLMRAVALFAVLFSVY